MKKQILKSGAKLDQAHQAVNTSALVALHVRPSKYPQLAKPITIWVSIMQIMSLRDGNASVARHSIAHEPFFFFLNYA